MPIDAVATERRSRTPLMRVARGEKRAFSCLSLAGRIDHQAHERAAFRCQTANRLGSCVLVKTRHRRLVCERKLILVLQKTRRILELARFSIRSRVPDKTPAAERLEKRRLSTCASSALCALCPLVEQQTSEIEIGARIQKRGEASLGSCSSAFSACFRMHARS